MEYAQIFTSSPSTGAVGVIANKNKYCSREFSCPFPVHGTFLRLHSMDSLRPLRLCNLLLTTCRMYEIFCGSCWC